MQQEKDTTLGTADTNGKAKRPSSLKKRGEQVEFQIKRLRRILPGEKDAKKRVLGILNDKEFIDKLSSEHLLDAATCALEHGIVEKGLELFALLISKFPRFEQGWLEYQEVLRVLGDKNGLVALRFRAKRSLSQEQFKKIFSYETENFIGEQHQPFDEPTLEPGSNDKEILEPFWETRLWGQHLQRFMSLFRGRSDVFARQWVDKNRQNSGYMPIRRPMTTADLEDHIKGSRTYGIYLMNPDNTVWTGVIDIDLKKKYRPKGTLRGLTGPVKREVRFILENIRSVAENANIGFIAEFSGGKGYHLWFPVEEAVPAASMRKALSILASVVNGKTEFFDLEIFPKQDRLSGKGLGNLVKLPLGIHRLTGKRSFFIMTGSRESNRQLAILESVHPTAKDNILALARETSRSEVILHPKTAKLAERFPQLFKLQQTCNVISKLISECLSGKDPGERGKKVLIYTVGHLNQGRQMLHHLLSKTPEYNRPLLDYEISRLRGTPLGCKRIHSLMGKGEGGLDCTFELKKGEYPHPLLHLDEFSNNDTPLQKAERIENLKDALLNLKTAIEIVERFI